MEEHAPFLQLHEKESDVLQDAVKPDGKALAIYTRCGAVSIKFCTLTVITFAAAGISN